MDLDEIARRIVESIENKELDFIEDVLLWDDFHEIMYGIIMDERYWRRDSVGEGMLPIYILYILGLRADKRSFNILREVIASRTEELDEFITEDLKVIFFNFGARFIDEIASIIFDENLDMYVRDAAISALCAIGAVNERLSHRIAEICRKFINEETNIDLIALALPAMAEVKDEELFALVKNTHKKLGEVAEDIVSIRELDKLHDESEDTFPEYTKCFKSLWLLLVGRL